jgi:phage tail sheath protein FI
MCTARGDLFAVLALPEHYGVHDAASYVQTLTTATTSGGLPSPLLSFGAVYHPWLHVADAADPVTVRRMPPDGPTMGVIAATATDRGPWVAPANVALVDVVALDPEIGPDAYLAMQAAHVNLVRREPSGFLCLAADTLADDPRPISVRRLLQALRRAALLLGTSYAFEPDSDVLRRTVQRTFEQLLGQMFSLGAFAGATADEGFLVNVGSPPNTPASARQGRLIVELQVAPSRPLAFITIRLVRSGAGTLEVEVL